MGRNQRKWRNILLDRNFQLSFTLILVGLAALLMVLLGLWVKEVAYESTLVGVNQLEPSCADLEDAVNNPAPPIAPIAPTDAAPTDPVGEPATTNAGADPSAAPPAGEPPLAGATAPDEPDPDRPRTTVVVEDTRMELTKPAPPPVAVAPEPRLVADLAKCNERKDGAVAGLWSSYRLILFVLFGAAFVLVLGLAIYGLRMTHKVAGPLFKVGLYLDKLKRGVYDQVWNLRKGDQLMEFYEHFRAAHRELAHMQADDIAVLEKVVAAFASVKQEGEGAKATSPELEAALSELRAVLEAKKDGLKIPEDKRG